MGIIGNLIGIRDITGPTFYKEFSEDNKQLADLEALYEKVKSKKRDIIKKDITYLKAGLDGEKNVNYELKNSFVPMICMHDIRIAHEDYIAQLDYVLVTEYCTLVIETKKLNGDITINEAGEFTRRFKNNYGKVIKEEGMYSPIVQNERHVRILEDMLKKNGLIKRRPVYSVVVIASPKSIINRSKAPARIKNDIIKYDQIKDYLEKMNKKEAPNEKMIESRMINIANFILQSNTEITYDYYKKYGLTNEDFYDITNCKDQSNSKEIIEEEVGTILSEINDKQCKIDDDLFEKLKKYRYEKSLSEGVKAYCIFTNNTLEELIKEQPKSKEELLKIQGFGKMKVEKYGEEILNIFLRHS